MIRETAFAEKNILNKLCQQPVVYVNMKFSSKRKQLIHLYTLFATKYDYNFS